MTQQGEAKKKTPGKTLLMWGVGLLALGVFLLIGNLTTTGSDYVAGVGMVEHQPTPSAASILLLLAGLVLAVSGAILRRRP